MNIFVGLFECVCVFSTEAPQIWTAGFWCSCLCVGVGGCGWVGVGVGDGFGVGCLAR